MTCPLRKKDFFEIYLEVALKFAKKGDTKNAERATKTMLKILKTTKRKG